MSSYEQQRKLKREAIRKNKQEREVNRFSVSGTREEINAQMEKKTQGSPHYWTIYGAFGDYRMIPHNTADQATREVVGSISGPSGYWHDGKYYPVKR